MILVTGTIAFDQIFNIPKKFSDYILPEKIHQINVSFTTDTMRKEFGGTGANQAYSLGLLGENVYLAGCAGKDFTEFNSYLKKARVNTKHVKVYPKELTATGFVLTDIKDNQIWGYSLGASRLAQTISIDTIIKSEKEKITMCIIAPNNLEALKRYVNDCIKNQIPYIFDPAFYIPQMKPTDLHYGLEHARVIFGNDYEIALMKSILTKNRLKLVKKLQTWITTFGSKGSKVSYYNKQQKKRIDIRIGVAKPKEMIDPTGAGDAYRSGFVAGMVHGFSPTVCGQMGAVASVFAIEHCGTINHTFTKSEFWKRFEENFGKRSESFD